MMEAWRQAEAMDGMTCNYYTEEQSINVKFQL